jgi:uncharacterized protein (TIGR03435 family)
MVADNTSLYRLITLAYGLNCRAATDVGLISGGPAWVRSDLFDFQATLPDGTPGYTVTQLNNGEAPKLQSMLQAMLANRFKLALRREMKDVPTDNLILVKLGKIKLSEDQTPPVPFVSTPAAPGGLPVNVDADGRTRGLSPLPQQRGTFLFTVDPPEGKVTIEASAIRILSLINMFQGRDGRLVVDKTEIKGLIDIPKQTLDVGPFQLDGVSVWPDIMQQLGMKLEPTRGSVEILVIDRVDKPSDN